MEHTNLEPLVGEWTIEAPSLGSAQGRMRVEWLEGGGWLILRSVIDVPEAPNGVMIIGGEPLAQHYFDSRGVHRVYRMSLEDGVWKLWRDSDDDDFFQRYAGTFSDDGMTINGAWEKSVDRGSTWEHDFDLRYERVRSGS